MPSCAVLHCNSSNRNNGLHFHRFPKNISKAIKWFKFCQKEESCINFGNATICSIHFHPEDYARNLRHELLESCKDKVSLIVGAVPSLNSPVDILKRFCDDVSGDQGNETFGANVIESINSPSASPVPNRLDGTPFKDMLAEEKQAHQETKKRLQKYEGIITRYLPQYQIDDNISDDGLSELINQTSYDKRTINVVEDFITNEEYRESSTQLDEQSGIVNDTCSSLCLICGGISATISIFKTIMNVSIIKIFSEIVNISLVDLSSKETNICTHCYNLIQTIKQLEAQIRLILHKVLQTFKNTLTDTEMFGLSNISSNELLPRYSLNAHNFCKRNRKVKVNDNHRKFPCSVCGKTFLAYSHRVEHMLIHINEKSYTCNKCNYATRTKSNLNKHLLTHNETKFECSECGKFFKTKVAFKDHNSSHHGKSNHVCQYCGKIFNRMRDKKVHEKLHTTHQNSLYSCDHCSKKFVLKSRLLRHLHIHDSSKQFECPECFKKFSRKDDLKPHLRIHTGEKPYICDQCGRSFRYVSNYRSHVKTHRPETEDIMLKCEVCNISYSSTERLREHQKSQKHKRNITMKTMVKNKSLSCEDCNTSFLSQIKLSSHKLLCQKSISITSSTNSNFITTQSPTVNDNFTKISVTDNNVECKTPSMATCIIPHVLTTDNVGIVVALNGQSSQLHIPMLSISDNNQNTTTSLQNDGTSNDNTITLLQNETTSDQHTITLLQNETTSDQQTITLLQNETINDQHTIALLQNETTSNHNAVTLLQNEDYDVSNTVNTSFFNSEHIPVSLVPCDNLSNLTNIYTIQQ